MTIPARRRVLFLLLLVLGAAGGTAGAAVNPFRILHHETLEVSRAATAEPGVERLSFDAYGRRFDVRLEPNERVQRALGARFAHVEALRGTLEGNADSWVRLTLSPGGRWHGMLSDGRDVYAVEPAEDVAEALVQPADAHGAAPVIFRLADALLPVGAASCGTVAALHEASALDAFDALAAESAAGSAPAAAQAAGSAPTRRLVVGVVADHEFARFFTDQGVTTPEEAILQRMNIVDGIFSAQLGVKIELAAPTVFRTTDDPFERTKANDLLEELRRYRARTTRELANGVTHLMTGRDMDGETVGIAYLGTLCGGGAATSLSEGTRSTTSAALIAAHEIAHNFNAPHDGDTAGACAATPLSFLMAPRLNGSQQFSGCSIEQMTHMATHGACLTAIASSDTTEPPPPPDPGSGGESGADAGAGGGGSSGFAMCLALALAAAARLRLRRARRSQVTIFP